MSQLVARRADITTVSVDAIGTARTVPFTGPADRQSSRNVVPSWVGGHPASIDRVEFVCFDDENLALYQALLS